MNRITILTCILLCYSSVVWAGNKTAKTNEKKLEKLARQISKTNRHSAKKRFTAVYRILFQQDSIHLTKLLEDGSQQAWYAYQKTLNDMKTRQQLAEQLDIKCDNYDYDYSFSSAKNYFSEINRKKGKVLLHNAAQMQSRQQALQAYNRLVFAYMLSGDQTLLPEIKAARKLSKKHVLININNLSDVAIPNEVKQSILAQFQSGEFKNMVVSTHIEPGEFYDFIVSITIDSIYVDRYWAGFFGTNMSNDLYVNGFANYTTTHNFRYRLSRNSTARAFRFNSVSNNVFKFLTPYEKSIIAYNNRFKGHIPLFNTFNIKGKYELINVRAKQVIASEPLNFYRKIAPSTLIPLTPGQNKEREILKFSTGFYATDLAEAFFTNPLFEKNISQTIQNELGRFLIDHEHVFRGEYVFANK